MFFKNLGFFISFFLILIAGFLVQYSVSLSENLETFNKHLFFFIFCIPITVFISFIPIEKIISVNKIFYFINLIILTGVLIIGKTSLGATRWLNVGGVTFQPSELVKISVILMIANYFSRVNLLNIEKLSYFFVPILYFIIPVCLILLQPNLGTSMIIILISCTMIISLFYRVKILSILFCLLILSMPFVWKFGLHDYQKERVLTFLNPESDPSGAGYNIIQSKIAIGSGGVFGRGYLNGTQNKLQFLPEQHNDFVFSVFAEEFGFIVTFLLIVAYFYFLLQVTKLAIHSNNITNKLILIGCNAMIFWHLIVNSFMSMDLIPVVGVPLPFISYGRSFLLANMICIGLIINIMRRNWIEERDKMKIF